MKNEDFLGYNIMSNEDLKYYKEMALSEQKEKGEFFDDYDYYDNEVYSNDLYYEEI